MTQRAGRRGVIIDDDTVVVESDDRVGEIVDEGVTRQRRTDRDSSSNSAQPTNNILTANTPGVKSIAGWGVYPRSYSRAAIIGRAVPAPITAVWRR